MSTTYKKYRVRVKTRSDEKHTIFSYGFTENQARLNGRKDAERLLKEPVSIEWIKET